MRPQVISHHHSNWPWWCSPIILKQQRGQEEQKFKVIASDVNHLKRRLRGRKERKRKGREGEWRGGERREGKGRDQNGMEGKKKYSGLLSVAVIKHSDQKQFRS